MNAILHKQLNKGENYMTYGSKEATTVLKAMEDYSLENSGEKMVFNGPSGKYKAITGRARVDGSITGVVHKFDAEGNTKLAGSFKILSDGYISRWTGVPTKVNAKVSGDALELLKLPEGQAIVTVIEDTEKAA
jgi:hypothetical protein